MPDFNQILLFLAAGLLLNLTPGPDVMFIVANAVRAGARAGVMAALGITAGCLVHVGAAALGVSALLTILLVGMAAIWAVNYSVVKYGAQQLQPMAYNATRIALAAAVLMALACRPGAGLPDWSQRRSGSSA